MKKFAAAAVAAAMTLSTFAPAADAASNKISQKSHVSYCTLELETRASGTSKQTEIKKQLDKFDKETELLAGSSKLGEAFGSSKSPEVEDFLALKACADGKDYQTTTMTKTEQVSIIMAVVIGIIATIAPMIMPHIKKLLPF